MSLQIAAEETDEFLLLLIVGDILYLAYGEFVEQCLHNLLISHHVLALVVVITLIVVAERAHEHKSCRIPVAEQCEALLGRLVEIAEANDVAAVLYRIEYAVGARISLQQSVHLQVLIDPQGVQSLGVESC